MKQDVRLPQPVQLLHSKNQHLSVLAPSIWQRTQLAQHMVQPWGHDWQLANHDVSTELGTPFILPSDLRASVVCACDEYGCSEEH